MDGVMLEESICVGDLLKNGGKFKINSNFIDLGDDDNLFQDLDTGDDAEDEFHEPIPSPWQFSFDELRALMKPITMPDEHKNLSIYKKLVREGYEPGWTGDPVRFTVHYSGYWEKATDPFDSTFLQGKPIVFVQGRQEVLEGLEMAVQTMRVGEESQFVIPYQLLFGELGCPDRILPRADGLFSITLIAIAEVANVNESEEIPAVDRNKYSVVMPKAKADYLKGKAFFSQTDYFKAARQFHRSVNTLECCKLSSESEQAEQQELLIKLYTNLAVCHNKLDNPRKVCLMCNEIGRISKINENCKALFQYGRALLKLGEFQKARVKLTQAQRLQPGNADISKELKLLADTMSKHAEAERGIWQRAFGKSAQSNNAASDGCRSDKEDNKSLNEQTPFAAVTLDCLNKFKQNEKLRQMTLPSGLSEKELDSVINMIKDMNIELDVVGGVEKEYILRKNQAK